MGYVKGCLEKARVQSDLKSLLWLGAGHTGRHINRINESKDHPELVNFYERSSICKMLYYRRNYPIR